MNAFADLDETSFVVIEPAGKTKFRAELKLTFMKLRSAERLALSFQRELLAEIGGPRYDIAWNAAKRLLLVKAGPAARFEASAPAHHTSARIIVPVPAGLLFTETSCEPEFYVDAVGKRLLIEVPVEFGRRLSLPSPVAPTPPVKPAGTSVSKAEIVEGNKDILRALGVTDRFPRHLRDISFTPAEARLLEALYRGKQVSRAGLLAATHDPEDGDDERDDKVVDVWLAKMRPKLALLDLAVQTLGGGAWGMDAASKGRLKEMLREIEDAA